MSLTSLAKLVFVTTCRHVVDNLGVSPRPWVKTEGREPDTVVSSEVVVGCRGSAPVTLHRLLLLQVAGTDTAVEVSGGGLLGWHWGWQLHS